MFSGPRCSSGGGTTAANRGVDGIFLSGVRSGEGSSRSARLGGASGSRSMGAIMTEG